jgi:hypothetical protein
MLPLLTHRRPANSGRVADPAQEDVAGRLHEALAHHPLALVVVPARATNGTNQIQRVVMARQLLKG